MPRATLRSHVGNGLALTNVSEPGSGFTAPEPIIVRGRRHKAILDRRGETVNSGRRRRKIHHRQNLGVQKTVVNISWEISFSER